MIEFKKAGEQDIALIYELAESIWKKHYVTVITMEQIEYMLQNMYSRESLKKQMSEGHEFTLLYDNGKPLGYISISTKDGKNYFLHKFYVLMNEQRKGLGTTFFNHMLSQLKEPWCIELTVNRKNYKAINFYFKNGFVIKDVADFDIGQGYFMNDFIMVKKLK
ncbi:MAG: GNAT family N-acetyltransferase [Bacteroidia bacterium]